MMPAPAATSSNTPPFDPAGGVVTTDRIVARKEASRVPPAILATSKECQWINDYFRGPRIGKGHHGEVYICYKYNSRLPEDDPDHFFRVAMKCVKRNNQREEKWRSFKKQNQLPTTPHTQLVDRVSTQETKIRKEIAIMKKLRHPHVVKLYEVIDDRSRKRIFMIMEYLGGGEVQWNNSAGEPILTVAQTRRIIRDAVLGLDYLHNQGIIHRDIKPANLLWTEDRRQVKIADFGVSHFSYAQRLAAAGDDSVVRDDPHDPVLLDDSDLTRRAGTPAFLAPEIVFEHTSESSSVMQAASAAGSSTTVQTVTLSKRPPITKAIDVWALGVTLYCLLFGHVPFTAEPGAAGPEWSLYNSICNSNWTVEPTMGADRIPTGGRHPHPKDTSEGASVVRLLDQFLQKDMKRRITLEEVKRNEWILKDLPEPQKWLNVTSPDGRIDVSTDETSDAMSTVHFRWNWGALTKRVSSFLRIRPQRSKDPDQDDRGPVKSDPHLKLRRRKSTATAANERLQTASSPIVNTSSNRDKGKRKADPTHTKRASQSLRSKSTDRYTGHSRNSSNVAIQGSSSKARRGSETVVGNTSSSQSSPTASDKGRSSTRFLSWLTRRGSPSTPAPGSPSPPEVASLPASRTMSLKQAECGARRSEEALRYHRFGQTLPQTSSLSAARRASSWGHGDERMEFAEVSSLVSAERVHDHNINISPGGVESSNERFTSMPRTPSKLGLNPLFPPAPRVIDPPESDSSSDSMFENEDEDEAPTPADDDGNLSTFSSSHSSGYEERWHNGSDLYDEHNNGDGDDGDDSDDQDNALTFSPSKRLPREE